MRISAERKSLMERSVALYSAGKSLREVSEEVGVPIPTIHRWTKHLGVEAHEPGSWHRGRNWTEARREHHPEKTAIEWHGPTGYDLVAARAIGNKSITRQGYVLVHVGRRSRRYEHTIVAERALGRQLQKGEVVHHINCIRHDNRPENLLVCTRTYHQQLHARMRSDPYWSEVERKAKTINHE